ncbi:aminotransferase class I/II-fold pyridoxal phosphate-dependent enzyme [Terribacillus saccharophilus]|uniref:aminotransferase class I/II-fold pyridoxal phosphate-dependent enzyme n=2 Tax=Terribacillus saccharophilus TaxID=361277 RepID=UPI000BA633B3|nr:aminotransferase class I/II-fold pyridoxal phosphate-dependent enzyme [Terribacillus saccharophilus]PAF18557.1 aminotransferase [Terribacillus saccharophilus]PAF20339.1 aminotransferase [Terribacillus saccharophilus]
MANYQDLSNEALQQKYNTLQDAYEAIASQQLQLDMSRGKPCTEQLDLSQPMLDIITSSSTVKTENGTDARNYGVLDGIPEAKAFFASILDVEPKQVIVGGNSSLTLMHDSIVQFLLHGVSEEATPWIKQDNVKFLCPSPGYDRHFTICEALGIKMIPVAMTPEGPDMEEVEMLVAADPQIKGIWCVPKYSNPDGFTYSDAVVDRLAGMQTAADDFRIFWDNAYIVHHLTEEPDELKNIMIAVAEAGNPDRVMEFTSTSKVTFPGSGVAALASSEKNITFYKKHLSVQSIGSDKLNQMRHVAFLKDKDTLSSHMKKHAGIIAPKFQTVLTILEEKLGDKGIADWTNPKGGYFISLNTMEGCAKDVVELAKKAGVTLTGAGATYPYGKDPYDRNIRIAPTLPPTEELKKAIDVLCLCVEMVSINRLLQK